MLKRPLDERVTDLRRTQAYSEIGTSDRVETWLRGSPPPCAGRRRTADAPSRSRTCRTDFITVGPALCGFSAWGPGAVLTRLLVFRRALSVSYRARNTCAPRSIAAPQGVTGTPVAVLGRGRADREAVNGRRSCIAS